MEWFLGIFLVWLVWSLLAGVVRLFKPRVADDPNVVANGRGLGPKALASTQKPSVSTRKPARWIEPGTAVEVAGLRIEGGMIYVGEHLPGLYGEADNCLINPNLKIAKSEPDWSGTTMPYWPSYSKITLNARRAYLEWLAGGRCDPEIGIGHVFLFLYGLERRLFVDKARQDSQPITREVQRLLALYGDNPSFRRYATAFLEGASLLGETGMALPPLSPPSHQYDELPLSLRIHLGAKLLRRQPILAEDALRWLLAEPYVPMRTPITRCFKEFVALWKLKFQSKYPKGLPVRTPKKTLIWRYQSASGSCHMEVPIRVDGRNIPDVSNLTGPANRLVDLATTCAEELASYSRFLGRNPQAEGTSEGGSRLPVELLSVSGDSAIHMVAQDLEKLFKGRSVASTEFESLAKTTGMSEIAGRPTVARLERLGRFLDQLAIAFEPDPRFGSTPPSQQGQILLFKVKDGAPIDATSQDYISMRTIAEVAVLASAADERMAAQEFSHVRSEIAAAKHLTAAQRLRLFAYAGAMWQDVPKQRTVLRRLAEVSGSERHRILDSACATVLADGIVDPREVVFLEKLAKALGLGSEDIYGKLHRGNVQDGPVSVAPAVVERSIPIPPKPEERDGIAIDEGKLRRIRQETSAVSELLSNIFVEVEQPQAAGQPANGGAQPETLFKGLDHRHSQLLRALLDRSGVSRAEFEGLAREANLLPEGALDTINDWAFERFDELLFDNEQVLAPADHIVEQLTELEHA